MNETPVFDELVAENLRGPVEIVGDIDEALERLSAVFNEEAETYE